MTAVAPLLRFSPSALPHEDLETIFVKREPLLRKLLASVQSTLRGGGGHHHLLVGPRGIGKTHLVSLVAHRLLALGERGPAVAWLDEDPWRIRSYKDLLGAVARTASLPGEGSTHEELEALIRGVVGSRGLVILVENLDQVFTRIGREGQHRLRALLERQERIALIATTTARFPGVSDREEPFAGMLDVDDLHELDLDEATQLLVAVARRAGDAELEQFLAGDLARRRLRVVAHLAGGHPRVWLLLAGCLSIAALDELVPLFLRSLDDLTPYYQSRVAELPADQQVLAIALVDAGGARTVRQLADETGIDQRSASNQLRLLVSKGLVRRAPALRVPSVGDARQRWYELREPLLRLTLKVKESRGEPLDVVVRFLRSWYGVELLDASGASAEGGPLLRTYLEAALTDLGGVLADPRIDDAPESRREQWFAAARKRDPLNAALAHAMARRFDEAARCIEELGHGELRMGSPAGTRAAVALLLAASGHLGRARELADAFARSGTASDLALTGTLALLAGETGAARTAWHEALRLSAGGKIDEAHSTGLLLPALIVPSAWAGALAAGAALDLAEVHAAAGRAIDLGTIWLVTLPRLVDDAERVDLERVGAQLSPLREGDDDLALAARIVVAGLAFSLDRDREHLLTLPPEEREIVQAALQRHSDRVGPEESCGCWCSSGPAVTAPPTLGP